MDLDPGWLISATLTLMIVFFKVWANRNDQRAERMEAHQEELAKGLEKLRMEVYKDFARTDDHRLMREDIRGIFDKINDLAEAVHTLIGQHRSSELKGKKR